MAILTIENDTLRVEISTLGAEMQSIRDKKGQRLYNGDPAYWTGRAPVLFPYAGGLMGNEFEYRGRVYSGAKHGFARRSEFTVEAQSADSATLRLSEPKENYPFDYIFKVSFRLAGDALTIDYITENPSETEPMYFGVGCHEAYACPAGIEGCKLVFDEPVTLDTNLLAGAYIAHETQRVCENALELPLKYDYFAVDALVFVNAPCKSVTLVRQDGCKARVSFADFDHLLLWTKPGAPYLCIEPWTNVPEYEDGSRELTEKPGIIRLEPGQTDKRTHTVRFF